MSGKRCSNPVNTSLFLTAGLFPVALIINPWSVSNIFSFLGGIFCSTVSQAWRFHWFVIFLQEEMVQEILSHTSSVQCSQPPCFSSLANAPPQWDIHEQSTIKNFFLTMGHTTLNALTIFKLVMAAIMSDSAALDQQRCQLSLQLDITYLSCQTHSAAAHFSYSNSRTSFHNLQPLQHPPVNNCVSVP